MTDPPTIYLAGPMTGHPDWNFPLFRETAEGLRRKGYRVLSPADEGLDDADWNRCMRRSITKLLQADAAAMLPGWQESKGARLEHMIASALSMDIWHVDALLSREVNDGTA